MPKHLKIPEGWQRLLLIVSVGFAFSASLSAQSSGSQIPKSAQADGAAHPDHASSPKTAKSEASPQQSDEQLRRAQIEVETAKLFQLSAELRAEVAKTYKDNLSVAALKKAEEVEKLARSLKARMNQEAAAKN